MINSIFPVQYLKTKYPGDVTAVKNRVNDIVLYDYESLETSSCSILTAPGVTTFVKDGFLQNDPELTDLTSWIKAQCKEFADALDYEPGHYQNEILYMWANYCKKGSYVVQHRHSPSYIAFVYYVDKQPGQGNFYFINPMTPILEFQPYKIFRSQSPEYVEKQAHPLLALVNEIETVTGDLIIFPAWLDHSAHPNNSNEPRIVIAGNVI
jgi:uncharacterized protein (TIGR02466 family)